MVVQSTMRANGRHERMHRTLKEETTRPAALTLRLQQKKFDRFRQVFNYERPHEGLNNATPGSVYQPSSVLLPRNPAEFVYPHGFILRRAATLAGTKAGYSSARYFDLRSSASNSSTNTSTRSIFGTLKSVSLTPKRFASGRFRSCGEWMFDRVHRCFLDSCLVHCYIPRDLRRSVVVDISGLVRGNRAGACCDPCHRCPGDRAYRRGC
jgi:transposase InsO family protein